ncbi:MAG: esterase-like activity of phytase family protein [Spirulinaceae cyanobacterium]
MKTLVKAAIAAFLSILLTACGISRITAQERLFPQLSLEFLGEYQLPKQTFQDTPVGGLSALTYNPKLKLFYILSDDRSQFAPARFYTFNIPFEQNEVGDIDFGEVAIEGVTFLKNSEGKTYPAGSIDPEGIAFSPQGNLFISSEGIPSQGVAPFIRKFDLKTGQILQDLRLPQRYLPPEEEEDLPRGVRENLGLEALTLNPFSAAVPQADPFRLFSAFEFALQQDYKPEAEEEAGDIPLRFMHYVVNPIGSPFFVAEHLYYLDAAPAGVISNGLTELVAIEPEGYFLSLERTYGLTGAGAKIYQVALATATDTTLVESFQGNIGGVVPLKKKLLLDLKELEIYLDNFEGMVLGPLLPDGSKSVILVSDNNFSEEQITQFLLFRLKD